MKLAFFSSQFPNLNKFYNSNESVQWGGVEEVTYFLTDYLSKQNEIYIFSAASGKKSFVLCENNITLFKYKSIAKIRNTFISIDLFFKPIKYNVDIVQIQRGSPPGVLAGYFYAKVKGIPYVVSYHGPIIDTNSRVLKFYQLHLLPHILKDASKVVVLNEKIARSEYLYKYVDKIIIIPNGIDKINRDRNAYDIDEEKINLLFLGSLVENKNIDIIIKAVHKLSILNYDVKLLIAGEGNQKEKLMELVEQLDLQSSVQFLGFITGDVKEKVYLNSDIFILPSKSEGSPLSVFEAMGFGVPTIVTNLPIYDEIATSECCLFIEPGNVDDLADCILKLKFDKIVIERVVNNGLLFVSQFDWEKVADAYNNVYRSLLKSG